jgi:hypothetical protein
VIRSPAGVDQCVVADRGPDFQPRLVQAVLERVLADSGDLRGFLRGQARDISRHDRRPVIRRQVGQGLIQRLAQFSLFQPPGGLVVGAGRNLQGFGIDGDAGRPAGTSLQ